MPQSYIGGALAVILSIGTILLYALGKDHGALAIGTLNGMIVTYLLGLHTDAPLRPAK